MRKIITIILLLCLLMPCIAEDIDLSGLTFEELAALRDRCLYEMYQREEWQEVTVPQGIWVVGKDIPAGTWTVKCADIGRDNVLMKYTIIEIGDKLDESKTSVDITSAYHLVTIHNQNNKYYKEGEITTYTFTVKEGYYIHIEEAFNMAVFMPYTGKPALGFK